MSEIVEKKLLEYLEHTKDFVLEQAPELFKEILKFDTIAAYLGSLTCVAVMAVAVFFSYKFYQMKFEKSYDRPSHHIAVWVGTAALIPFLFVQIVSNVSNIIQIRIAPKYYLLEKLK